MYDVANFDKYEGFKELTNITDVSQLQVGDVICWEGIDINGKENDHAQIWAGNGMVWESAEAKPITDAKVRYEKYTRLADNWYYNSSKMQQDTVSVRYFRPTDELVRELYE